MNLYKSVGILFFIVCLLYSCTMKEGGVRLVNDMESYAVAYIKNKKLLNTKEKLIAYYDYTKSLDGTKSILLTDTRLIYHTKGTSDYSILLEDIMYIKHKKKSIDNTLIEVYSIDILEELEHIDSSMMWDVIEVYIFDSDPFVIEIPPEDNGVLFLNVLQSNSIVVPDCIELPPVGY